MRRLFESLDSENSTQRPSWQVGGRYEVVRPLELIFGRSTVKLAPQTTALVLAIRVVEDEGEEVIMGYLADTCSESKKDGRWQSGWGPIWRPGEGPKLSRRAQQQWTLGGCYRVKGKPVLRIQVDLDTEPLCELENLEEVLLVDLALALTKNEPRLRGKVRTDRGVLGWLTIELPKAPPLLHDLNLHCKEAILGNTLPLPVPVWLDTASCKTSLRRSTRRAPVVTGTAGTAMHPWDVGGTYRTLEKVKLDEGPWLRAGKLVKVEAIRPFASTSGVDLQQLRLNLKVESGTLAGRNGWITTSSCIEEASLDVRNHLEFQQVTELPTDSPTPLPTDQVFTVRLQRSSSGTLGLQLRGLDVDQVLEKGALAEWNEAHPSQRVHNGDRIIAVNGLDESIEIMISEMKEKQLLYLRFLRSDSGADVTSRPSLTKEATEKQELWKSERLAEPAALIVSKTSKESAKLQLPEDDEPEWQLFHEGVPHEEAHHGSCVCRDRCKGPCKEHCNEELLLWLSCAPSRKNPSRGLLEPAPEPSNG